MAEINGGTIIARQLKAAGIDTAFGVVAGPMIEVMAEMQREGINVISCRHEENAAFMASAWGYITKMPGIIVAGSGPAVSNCLTPMYVATESGMPLIVLGGSALLRTRGTGGFQEADQVAWAKPATKWAIQVDSQARIPEYLHLAMGKALLGRPGAVYLDFPGELISTKIDEATVRFRERAPDISPPHPDPMAVIRIADLLARAERPLLLIGKGAAWADAGPALTELVNRGIPFVSSPMARGTIADDNPFCVNAARSSAIAGADAILMVGGRFNWMFQWGKTPVYAENVRIAQVEIEPEELYSSANVEIGVVADAAVAAERISQVLEGRKLRSTSRQTEVPGAKSSGWLAELRNTAARNEASLTEQMESAAKPINHYRLVADLRDVVTADTTVSVDAEMTMGVARAVLSSYNARVMLNSGTTGCMGTGVPYAIGAKLARPEHPSVALLGDYAFGAAAMEVETCARADIPVVFVISNNAGIAGHQLQDRMFAPDAPPIAALLPADYEKMAEMVGGYARRVTDPADIKPALKEALASKKVSVINVITDPKGSRKGALYLG